MMCQVLGRTSTLVFRTDPALIAGVELHTPGMLVRNSWQADLERIAGELHQDEQHVARIRTAGLSRPALGWMQSNCVPNSTEIGRVQSVGDGIALIAGLPHVRLNELLRFDKGQFGIAQTLDRDAIGCVLLDEGDGVEAGDIVRGTGEVVRVPIGPALLGRVVDPLGRALDDGPAVAAAAHAPIEQPAPAIIERDLVTEPVQTGILVIDALFALGRGQRELIIGDRATGKTAIAIDTIINQKSSDLICVYVAVGQKSSTVARVIDAVRQHGAPERCIFVVAQAAAMPGLQWIAPFAGFTMAEYFRDRGQHALIVIDDLTKHAATHREIALLMHQPPGREAYPGDIFYLHARLLERAAKLSSARGGGSLTALPIAETDAGNLSAYIPTNLISITDGQLVLDTKLFREGNIPAIDVGTSVSRVGGKTQAAALREQTGTLRLDYAQYLELEMFTRFGGLSDARVKAQMDRGARTRALFIQPRFAPLRLADEVALAFALRRGVARCNRSCGNCGVAAGASRLAGRDGRRLRASGSADARDGNDRPGQTAPDLVEACRTPYGPSCAVTERLADISAHIHGVDQLRSVIGAMRAIAAARAQQSRGLLPGIRAYAGVIAQAIAQALRLLPDDHVAINDARPIGTGLVLFTAEQGFAGAFSDRMMEVAKPLLPHAEMFLVGTRGAMLADERQHAHRLANRDDIAQRRCRRGCRADLRGVIRAVAQVAFDTCQTDISYLGCGCRPHSANAIATAAGSAGVRRCAARRCAADNAAAGSGAGASRRGICVCPALRSRDRVVCCRE